MMPSDRMAEAAASAKVPVLAAFEGGGARGIAHIAGWKAAVSSGLEFRAVAGTSAGSIIAALLAAGGNPDQVFDPADPSKNILFSATRKRPDQLFKGWWRLASIRWIARSLRVLRKTAAWRRVSALVPFLLVALVLWLMVRAEYRWSEGLPPFGQLPAVTISEPIHWLVFVAPFAALILGAVVWLWPVLSDRGLFPNWPLENAFEAVLRDVFLGHLRSTGRHDDLIQYLRSTGRPEKLIGYVLTFQDLREFGCPRLVVIATDVKRGEPVLFDYRTHPNLSVAKAVTASVAVPGLIQPVLLPASDERRRALLLLDGGMVSNLPAWVFEDERFSDPDIETLAFGLPDATDQPDDAKGYWTQVFSAAVFGGQNLATRSLIHMNTVGLPSAPLTMIDFDMNSATARDVYFNAKTTADNVIKNQLLNSRTSIRELLTTICTIELDYMDYTRYDKKKTQSEPISASIITRISNDYLAVRFHQNMRKPLERNNVLAISSTIAGRAFEKKQPLVWFSDTNECVDEQGDRLSLVPSRPLPDIVGLLIAVPIFRDAHDIVKRPSERSSPVAILAVDWPKTISLKEGGLALLFRDFSAILADAPSGAGRGLSALFEHLSVWSPLDGQS